MSITGSCHCGKTAFRMDAEMVAPAGIMKDTVVVPFYGRAAVDFVANQPGLTLVHCHIQHHMDFGFKALFRYA